MVIAFFLIHFSLADVVTAQADVSASPQKWLAGLFSDLPDIRGKRFVRVSVGPINDEIESFGWLLKEDVKKLSFLRQDGCETEFSIPSPDAERPIREKNSRKTINLGDAVYHTAFVVEPAEVQAAFRQFFKKGIPTDKYLKELVTELPVEFQASVAEGELANYIADAARKAHFAFASNAPEIGLKLLDLAETARIRLVDRNPNRSDECRTVRSLLTNRVAQDHRLGLIQMANANKDRKEILAAWQKFAAAPEHLQRLPEFKSQAAEMIKLYRTLIDEDSRWMEPDVELLRTMSVERKAAVFIHKLRDLTDPTWKHPGERSIHDDEINRVEVELADRDGDPVNELVKLGFNALPFLIEHIDDRRPMRCCYLAPDQLRVGDCCQQLFEQITGHSLGYKYGVQNGNAAQIKANAVNWLRDYEKKGRRQFLIEATQRGNRESSYFGARLAVEFPDAALDPIVRGVRATTNEFVRASLITSANRLPETNQLLTFTREEADGPFVRSRIRAAEHLMKRGERAGLDRLLLEWRTMIEKKVDRAEFEWAFKSFHNTVQDTANVGAIRLFAIDLPNNSSERRCWILHRFSPPEGISKLSDDAIEDLLANSFEDTAGDTRVMVADVAAERLSQFWGQPNLFDSEAPLQTRDRQRLEMKNILAKKRGLPVRKIAERRTRPAEDFEVEPLLKIVLAVKEADGRRVALKQIEDLGLPALPFVRKALKRIDKNHPANSDLQSLASRMALIVAEVRINSDSVEPGERILKKFNAMLGKPLTEGRVAELFDELAAGFPRGARAFRFWIERLPDDSGVYLAITFARPEPARAKYMPSMWYCGRFVVGAKELDGVHMSFSGTGSAVERIDWSDWHAQLKTVLLAPSDQYFFVFAMCYESEDMAASGKP